MPKLARQQAVAEGTTDGAERVTPLATPNLGSIRTPRGRWWRDAHRRRYLALADVCAATLATLAVTVPATGTFWGLLFLPIWPLFAKLFGLYDRDHRALRHLTADEVPSIFAWVGVTTAVLVALLSLTPVGLLEWGPAIETFFAASFAAIGFRSLTRWLWWKRTPPELVGLVGDGPAMASLQRKFQLFQEMHLELAAVRDIKELGIGRQRDEELRALADRVDRIVVAATGVEADLISYLKDVCRARQVKISVVSPLRGKALPSERFVQFADLPILEYNTWDPSRSTLLDPAAVRRRRGHRRPAAVRPVRDRRGDRDQAGQPRAGSLLADPRRSRRPAVPHVQAADDDRRRRGESSIGSSTSRDSTSRSSSSGTIRA